MKSELARARELFAQQGHETDPQVELTDTQGIAEDPVETEEPQAVEPEVPEVPETEEPEEDAPLAAETGEDYTEVTTDQIEDIHQYAEATGVDLEYLYSLKIPVKNGEPVTLGQFKDQLQDGEYSPQSPDQAEIEVQRQQLAEQQAAFEEQRRAMMNAPAPTQEVVAAAARLQALQQDAQRIDWAELEKKNPGVAANERSKLQIAMGQAQQEYNYAVQSADATRQQQMGQIWSETEKVMASKYSEWREPEKKKAAMGEIEALMHEYGYTNADIANTIDNKPIRMMQDLIALRKQVGDGNLAAKKVVKAPKFLKGGGPKPAVNPQTRIKRLKRQAQEAPAGKRRGAELDAVKAILSTRNAQR